MHIPVIGGSGLIGTRLRRRLKKTLCMQHGVIKQPFVFAI